MTGILGSLTGPDPYPLLDRLRADDPVTQLDMPDGARIWLVTRYEDARRALADPRLSKGGLDAVRLRGPEGYSPTSQHMLSADPPDHTRLRKLVSAGFTPRRVEQLEPRITEIALSLLDAMADLDEVDLIDSYAFPLPIQVICELLGVPVEDRDTFRAWSNVIVSGASTSGAERVADLRTTLTDLVRYIRELLAAKRAAPADDLLSALLAVHDGGDELTDDELVSMVFLMLIAGHETTVNLIGNGMYLLLTHPSQRALLANDPSLLPGAIEEFLRYEGPVKTSTYRVTTEPVEYSGVTIPAGEPVLISLLSANRDPSRIADADRLDIARQDAAHLAFGHGIHFCLGAALARMEGRIAIDLLLKRFPDLRLAAAADSLDWRPGLLIRGLTKLPVSLQPHKT